MSSRHVLLIITGIMLTFGCSALTFSTWTNFQPVVSEAMGMVTSTGAIDTAPFALYITVLYLTMTVVSPMAGKLIQKMDIRIILSVSAALVGIAFILMSIYTEIWQFYISGVLLGLGEISILWLAIPTLMNRWFKKSGTSYQTIYLIWGIVALATSLPFTLFCIRSTPEEVGLQPYGAEIAEDGTVEKAKGLSASKAMKSPVFYAVFIYAGIINFLTIIAPQFPSYMRSLGAAGTVAYDVAVVTMITAFVAGVAGILLVWLGVQSEIALYAGACIYGFFFASAVVLCPIVVRQVFGTREYSEIYSRVSVFVNLMGAFGATIWAFLGSNFGYDSVFIVGIVGQVVVLLCGLYAFGKQKSVQAQWTE